MAEATESVERFTMDFGQRRVLIPSGQPNGQLSGTELHRIRRAFWRFFQVFDERWTQHGDNIVQKARGATRFTTSCTRTEADPGKEWVCGTREVYRYSDLARRISIAKDWELNELVAVRDFLRGEVNSVQLDREMSPGILQDQPLLTQRLIMV